VAINQKAGHAAFLQLPFLYFMSTRGI
jgi:hypothetical protein